MRVSLTSLSLQEKARAAAQEMGAEGTRIQFETEGGGSRPGGRGHCSGQLRGCSHVTGGRGQE